MARDKKKEEKPKKNDLRSFLKKRAPIYLGLVALFAVFIVPELTKGDLEGCLPELSAEEQQVVDVLMGYNGPDRDGFTLREALSKVISDEYPDERIFDDKKTSCDLIVSGDGSSRYQVAFNFESHKGEINFDWSVDTGSGEVIADDPKSKSIVDFVNFYD